MSTYCQVLPIETTSSRFCPAAVTKAWPRSHPRPFVGVFQKSFSSRFIILWRESSTNRGNDSKNGVEITLRRAFRGIWYGCLEGRGQGHHHPPAVNYIEPFAKVDFPAYSSFRLQSAGEIKLRDNLNVVHVRWLVASSPVFINHTIPHRDLEPFPHMQTYLTECVHESVLESLLPNKNFNLLSSIKNQNVELSVLWGSSHAETN